MAQIKMGKLSKNKEEPTANLQVGFVEVKTVQLHMMLGRQSHATLTPSGAIY